ncbi:MAG TPA: archease, partial [Nitrososphaera sp.]|nr:archease [Nitrososphaera sp.]
EEAFVQGARGLVDTMVELATVRPVTVIKMDAEGHDLESLLFDWLDKVMLSMVADGIALSEFSIQIQKLGEGYSLNGIARGEKIDLARHRYKVEIKAITYHEMLIRREKGRVTIRFLVDL